MVFRATTVWPMSVGQAGQSLFQGVLRLFSRLDKAASYFTLPSSICSPGEDIYSCTFGEIGRRPALLGRHFVAADSSESVKNRVLDLCQLLDMELGV